MRYLAVLVLLVSCGGEPEITPASEGSDGCFQGYTGDVKPTPPLSYEKCFGNFQGTIQSSDPRAPNYVSPRCPCAPFVPDAGR